MNIYANVTVNKCYWGKKNANTVQTCSHSTNRCLFSSHYLTLYYCVVIKTFLLTTRKQVLPLIYPRWSWLPWTALSGESEEHVVGVATREGPEFQTGQHDQGFKKKGRVSANKRQGDVKTLKYSKYIPAFPVSLEIYQYYGGNSSQRF